MLTGAHRALLFNRTVVSQVCYFIHTRFQPGDNGSTRTFLTVSTVSILLLARETVKTVRVIRGLFCHPVETGCE